MLGIAMTRRRNRSLSEALYIKLAWQRRSVRLYQNCGLRIPRQPERIVGVVDH
jgi:hypothetical protein